MSDLVYSVCVFVFENIIISKTFSIGTLRSQDEERYEDNFFKIDKQIGKASVTWIFRLGKQHIVYGLSYPLNHGDKRSQSRKNKK